MNSTLVSDPKALHQQWSELYGNAGLSPNLTVVEPNFTAARVREMYDRAVPRIPLFVHPSINRTHILRMADKTKIRLGIGTYSVLQRLSRVSEASIPGWVFVEVAQQAPYKDKLERKITAQEILREEGALGMSIEEYIVLLMYSRNYLELTIDTRGSCSLLGSKSEHGGSVLSWYHEQEGLMVVDNIGVNSWVLGQGLRSVIPA